HSRCCWSHRVDHTFSALAGRRRTSPRQLEIRSTAAHAFSFFYDVQSLPVSELQGAELEDEKVDSAFSCHQSYPHPHGHELRMDAGSAFSGLFTLRIFASVAVALMATRNRRRDRRRIA